jgi:hypothetical protein
MDSAIDLKLERTRTRMRVVGLKKKIEEEEGIIVKNKITFEPEYYFQYGLSCVW